MTGKAATKISIICVTSALLASAAAFSYTDPPGTVRECPAATTVKGADISAYQGFVQWPKYLSGGSHFAIIKATEGSQLVDRFFAESWQKAREAGVLRAPYHFFRPGQDPDKAADLFLMTVGSLERGDLPPMMDWEETDQLDSATVVARAQVWLDRVEKATGTIPIIYTYPDYWRRLGNPAGFDRYPLFIAGYDVKCPEVPAPWTHWTFWQHRVGYVKGIYAPTDLDVFNGALEELMP